MDGMIAQRQAGQFCKQLLGRFKGDLRSQSGPSLLHVPLRAALSKLEGFIHGRKPLLTGHAVEIGTGQGDLADHGMHRARRGRSRSQETLTVGTRQRALLEHLCMSLFHQAFGDPARQLLAHGKHRLGHLLQAGWVIGHVCLQFIQPHVHVCMQMVAGSSLGKGLASFLKGENGCRGHLELLHSWAER